MIHEYFGVDLKESGTQLNDLPRLKPLFEKILRFATNLNIHGQNRRDYSFAGRAFKFAPW